MLESLAQHGSTAPMREQMLDHQGLWSLFDYPEWTTLEARFTDRG